MLIDVKVPIMNALKVDISCIGMLCTTVTLKIADVAGNHDFDFGELNLFIVLSLEIEIADRQAIHI